MPASLYHHSHSAYLIILRKHSLWLRRYFVLSLVEEVPNASQTSMDDTLDFFQKHTTEPLDFSLSLDVKESYTAGVESVNALWV